MASAPHSSAEAMLPHEILTALLVMAAEESGKKRLEFRGHDSRLQRVFWTLSKDSKSAFLDAFVFSDSGPEPYSPVLSESISLLQLSGFVGRNNPDYEMLFLNPAAEQYFEAKLKQKFSEYYDIHELKRVADQFLRLVRE